MAKSPTADTNLSSSSGNHLERLLQKLLAQAPGADVDLRNEIASHIQHIESDHEKNFNNSDNEVHFYADAAQSTSHFSIINAEKQSADDDGLSEENR